MSPPRPPWPDPAHAFTSASARRAALSGRVAVITGASRGLGAGMAATFATSGLNLGLCARHRPDLVASTRPRAHDGRVSAAEPPLSASVDVSDPDALEEFARAVIERFGRIDLWINNAGLLAPIGPLAASSPADVARHFSVNVTGLAFGTQLFARHVRDRPGEGVLINMSSGAATSVYSGWAPYCASKAAVERLTEVVAVEERGSGLRCYAVSPGVVDTDMQDAIRATTLEQFPEGDLFRQLKADDTFNSTSWVADRLLDLAFGDHPPRDIHLRVPDEFGPQFSG